VTDLTTTSLKEQLINEGASIPLAQAVQELLMVVDEILGEDLTKRSPVSGGVYMDRWRFERLRNSHRVTTTREGV
jgi:hypothetical protein